jgi:uncharacterized repeat protein (TIGR01451 family)
MVRRKTMQGTARVGAVERRTVVLLAAAAALVALAVMMVTSGGAVQAQTAQGAELKITKSVSPKVVAVGERQTFTIKVTNRGDRRARNVTMSDPLPAKVRFIRASTIREVPGSCGLEPGRTVVCDLGALRPGRAVTVKIHVRTIEAGGYTNRAFVRFGASALGPGAPADQDAATSRVVEGR